MIQPAATTDIDNFSIEFLYLNPAHWLTLESETESSASSLSENLSSIEQSANSLHTLAVQFDNLSVVQRKPPRRGQFGYIEPALSPTTDSMISTPSTLSYTASLSSVGNLWEELPGHHTPETSPAPWLPPNALLSDSDSETVMGGSNQFFWGNACEGDWVPLDFLKSIQQTFKENQSDTFKKEKLANCLATNSIAEEWYEAIRNKATTWNNLIWEFKKRWPKEKVVAVTIEQRRHELRKEVLKEEDMEWRVTVNGVEMLGWAAWASKIAWLAALANDSGGALIGLVQDMMPYVLHKLVVGEFSAWTDFCDVVKRVDNRELKLALEEETQFTKLKRENLDLHQKVEMHAPPMPPLSPMLNIAHQMGSFNLNQSTSTATPQAALMQNLFQGSQMLLNNLFAPHPTHMWEEHSIQLAKYITGMIHHTNNNQGCAEYTTKVTEWRTAHLGKYGGDEFAPFPLTPGTTSVASGECFQCGHTHQWWDGDPCTQPKIPREERLYRAIASRIVQESCKEVMNMLQSTPAVSAVHAYGGDDFIFIPTTSDYPNHYIKWSSTSGSQGNGRGPTV